MSDNIWAWHDFCVAQAGAAAALAGLLFVAVSINLGRILEYANLPLRVIEALIAFIAVLFVASFVLVPHQPPPALGLEISVTGLGLWLVNMLALRADLKHSPAMTPGWNFRKLTRVAANQLPPLPFIVGGSIIAFGMNNGLYWIVPGTLLCFASGLFGAWVLLIEIQR